MLSSVEKIDLLLATLGRLLLAPWDQVFLIKVIHQAVVRMRTRYRLIAFRAEHLIRQFRHV